MRKGFLKNGTVKTVVMIQLNIIDAIEQMEAGIQQAVDNADARQPDWSATAYTMLALFTQERKQPFRCEEFRQWCEGRLMPPPHDRAFGGVIRMAARNKIIRQVGFDKTENPKAHRANCALWIKA